MEARIYPTPVPTANSIMNTAKGEPIPVNNAPIPTPMSDNVSFKSPNHITFKSLLLLVFRLKPRYSLRQFPQLTI